jgi:hypothetical protein
MREVKLMRCEAHHQSDPESCAAMRLAKFMKYQALANKGIE